MLEVIFFSDVQKNLFLADPFFQIFFKVGTCFWIILYVLHGRKKNGRLKILWDVFRASHIPSVGHGLRFGGDRKVAPRGFEDETLGGCLGSQLAMGNTQQLGQIENQNKITDD